MEELSNLTAEELSELPGLVEGLTQDVGSVMDAADLQELRSLLEEAVTAGRCVAGRSGINPYIHALRTARLVCSMLQPDRHMVTSVLVAPLVASGVMTQEQVASRWGDDVARLVKGRMQVEALYGRSATVMQTENFRNLLLTFAEDIRVILNMIIDRQALLRAINHHPDEDFVREIASEAQFLYAPLAHRLGLYKVKSDLEDLSLKYTNREIYTRIARGLNEKKESRDRYIAAFIEPIKRKLEEAGLQFDIKGRTKSIYSIWNKLRKQQIELKDVYDLFAIRIILDVPPEHEKAECWKVYSIIADMYTPNPARLKDWLSIPKSNGYESLHTTVRGPENKWVEVQIRSRRMDLVAEKGLAAHWKYKGIKQEGDLDAWMNNIRDILEVGAGGPLDLMKDMKMDLYDKEVFVFTPKGDLLKLPQGATVLDFAFNIHSNVGCRCTGGRVNGRNRKINYKLRSGDTVEVTTSSTQVPKQDWLRIAVTSKARSKIRQTLNEREKRAAELGKEMLMRRAKNRKLEIKEATLMKLIKHRGYKSALLFFADLGEERLSPAEIIEAYEEMELKQERPAERVSAEEFQLMPPESEGATGDGHNGETIVIGEGIKGINYRLAKCCNPVMGDPVFGFISSEGVIKIHRTDCPNALNIRRRYPYRMIATKWAGRSGAQFNATLSITGQDDIGIVTNITSVINKEPAVSLRSIKIDSHDGLFRGYVGVGISDTEALSALVRKLKSVKGVKDVTRS